MYTIVGTATSIAPIIYIFDVGPGEALGPSLVVTCLAPPLFAFLIVGVERAAASLMVREIIFRRNSSTW